MPVAEPNPPDLQVTADAGQLTQMTLNLAINACEAMGYRGSLRIALSMEPANEDAIVALAELLIADGNNDEALALLGEHDGALADPDADGIAIGIQVDGEGDRGLAGRIP